jgi:hypothetical protein
VEIDTQRVLLEKHALKQEGGMIPEGLELIPQESRELVERVSGWMGEITEIKISTPQEAEYAQKIVRAVLSHEKEIKNAQKTAEEPYSEPLTKIKTLFKTILTGLDNLKRKSKLAIDYYTAEQERKRREEQRRLEIEAAEKRRKAEEAARAAEEEARKAREEAARLESEGKAAEAAKLQAQAEKQEARAIQKEQAAANIVAPIAVSAAPIITGRGIGMRDNWKGAVEVPESFKAWCIQNQRYEFLSVDESAWNRYAKVVKSVQSVPGARIYLERA